jgi:hypothetical protein
MGENPGRLLDASDRALVLAVLFEPAPECEVEALEGTLDETEALSSPPSKTEPRPWNGTPRGVASGSPAGRLDRPSRAPREARALASSNVNEPKAFEKVGLVADGG